MRAATPDARVATAERVSGRRAQAATVGAVAVLVAATAIWGGILDRHDDGIGLHAAPLFAAASNRLGPLVAVPLTIAALVVWRGPALAELLGWRHLVAAAMLAAAAWGVGLALVDHGITEGLVRGATSPHDLLADASRITAPGEFLSTFVDRIGDYVVHVRGHPPGLVVALSMLGRVGLGGVAGFVTLAIVAGAAVVGAVLVAVREVAGEAAARKAAPFLVLSPAAIWLVTSADAVYAGLAAIGIAASVVATGRAGRRSDLLAAVGGLVLGAGLFSSYGLVLVLLVPFAVGVLRRRVRPLVISGLLMVVVGVGFAAAGFSWIDGLWATRAEYAGSIAAVRPYGYFVFANLAAFAIVLGPAPVAGIATLRERRMWLLVGAALVAVAAADLSGLSKGEVERIWLPFWPWIAIAAAAITSRVRWWLAAQATLAIGVQTFLGTPW